MPDAQWMAKVARLAPFVCATLLVLMLLAIEGGRRLGRHRKAQDDQAARAGLGAIEGAVFALLGLLIAFTFSGAAARFDARREMIVAEANAVGTAWLRIDLVGIDAQSELRDLFRQYLDARLAMYARGTADLEGALVEHRRAATLQTQIWSRSVQACEGLSPAAASLLLSSLNQMFDIASARVAATRMHPPAIIYLMLIALVLIAGLFAGYGMSEAARRSLLHMVGFAIIMTATIYVILDLEFPRVGFIRVDPADQILRDVRRQMDPPPQDHSTNPKT